MAQAIIVHHVDMNLRPAPINPDWVIDGSPTARNLELSRSPDGLARTVLWDCTPGRFQWIYDIDETIHILEGSVMLDDGVAGPRRYGPGDVVFFPAGAIVQWTVEIHVRKLAFFRRGLPAPIAKLTGAMQHLKAAMRTGASFTGTRQRKGRRAAA